MANPEHIALVRKPEDWNKWRLKHLETIPDLREAALNGANLSGADLLEAKLGEADLIGAELTGADLRGADLREADLNRANLTKTKLSGAKLRWAKLNGADLHEADLRWAELTKTKLSGANLHEARLDESDLIGADLTKANLSGANLREASLNFADLAGADLRGARVGWTTFGNTDLSVAKGLNTVEHFGPSTIGIDTLYKSGGKIPDVFLRGAGVPDTFIAYAGSLVGNPIEFYSCFMSYSTKDQPFADRLHADLQAKGVRCWFAPHKAAGGKKLNEQIDEAIRLYDRLLLILSKHSMKSEWVKTEIAKARKRELREKRRMLFPLRLVGFNTLRDWECFDADAGKDSALEIREYFIPDFSHWKEHDRYQEAFDRLLRDLKTETAAAE